MTLDTGIIENYLHLKFKVEINVLDVIPWEFWDDGIGPSAPCWFAEFEARRRGASLEGQGDFGEFAETRP